VPGVSEALRQCGLEEEGKEENRSRLFWTFANRIAEQVEVKYPSKIIGTLAYSYSRYPYPELKLHRNLMPFYVGTSAAYLDDKARAEREQHLAAWGRAAQQLGSMSGTLVTASAIPVPYDHLLQRSLRYAYANHARASYSEVYPTGASTGTRPGSSPKLLWNPQLDVDALLEDFCHNFFGEAYEPMKAYVLLCERWGETRTGYKDPASGAEPVVVLPQSAPVRGLAAGGHCGGRGVPGEGLAAAKSDLTRRRVQSLPMPSV